MNGHSRLCIAAGHPAFAGHFPGCPILPGAVLLDEVLQTLERAHALDLTQWRIVSAKFLTVVRPGAELCIEHAATADGSIRFTIRTAAATVATGTLAMGPDGQARGA